MHESSSMRNNRTFAIVPAAGRSQRMGCPKLLLQWQGKPILEHVLLAWRQSRVERTVVVARRDDLALHELCAEHNVDCVIPDSDPSDMRQSVEHGLKFLTAHHHPTNRDAWLLAPADLPRLSSGLIDRVIEQYEGDDSIIVPRCGLRTGHPVLFPWPLSRAVLDLAANEGFNRLVAIQAAKGLIKYIELDSAAPFDDIDTTDDFERLCL